MNIHSQNTPPAENFNVAIREANGDLNRDGLEDKVTITMDTIHETRPLKLEVFFAQPSGQFKSIAATTKIIEAQYPVDNGGKHNGNSIPNVIIKEGNLQLDSYVKGQTFHTFRYKNGNFELIHFASIAWDGKETTTEINFDLITGTYVVQSQVLGSDEVFEKIENKKPVNPLPKIQDFIPFQTELY